jgi:ComF family protein
MHRAAAEFWGEADLIMPVPLHRWRLFKRRYNQAALLAYNLAALGHKRYAPDTLVHHRATPSQGHLARKDRQKNVKGAFGLNPRYRDHMRARNVILVDDVLTTGSIMDECARLLLDSGAKTVNALVLARVRGYL